MPLVLSLPLAAGVLLVYLAATSGGAEESAPGESLVGRLEAFLEEAGVEGVTTRDFLLLSAGAGTAAAVAVQLALGWPVVTAAAFLVGLALPCMSSATFGLFRPISNGHFGGSLAPC